jgi:hypothetical protein
MNSSNKAAISLTTGLEDAGRYLVCPICIKSKQLDADSFITGAEPGGSVQLWEWIGDGATTFSY